MKFIRFLLLILLLIPVTGNTQTIFEYLESKDLQTLIKDYNEDEEKVIDSLINFTLLINDRISTQLMWYSEVSVNHNPLEKRDPNKYCSLKFKAYSWINLIFEEQSRKDLNELGEKFFVIKDNGKELFDYRMHQDKSKLVFGLKIESLSLTLYENRLIEWRNKLKTKGLSFLRNNKISPLNRYSYHYVENWSMYINR